MTEKYMTPHSYYDIAIEGQPKEQIYYHRSIQDIGSLTPKSPESLEKALFFRQIKFCVYGNTVIYVV